MVGYFLLQHTKARYTIKHTMNGMYFQKRKGNLSEARNKVEAQIQGQVSPEASGCPQILRGHTEGKSFRPFSPPMHTHTYIK